MVNPCGFLSLYEVHTPYKLDGNCVVKSDGSAVPGGCHKTHAEAVAHMRALYANVPDAKTKEVSAVASPNNLSGPNSLTGVLGMGREKKKRKPMDESVATKENSGFLVSGSDGDHLPTRKNGKLDHGLMGAAFAALTVGYRGNKYEGPAKEAALSKLRALYKSEGIPTPDESKSKTKGYDEHGSLAVTQGADGAYRWILRSSSGFRDRDGELVTTKALEDDCERMNATGQFGPLRWWHIGSKSETPEHGLDIGDCDFAMMSGHTRIESGTFRHPALAVAIKSNVDSLGGSLGFKYPVTQPDADKTISYVRTFERSVLPKPNVSNLMALKQRLTGISEDAMTEAEQVAKLKELVGPDNHALVDSFLASSKRDEATLTELGVGVKATKKEMEAEEENETPEDEKKESPEKQAEEKKMGVEKHGTKETPVFDTDALATALMTKMTSVFVTPAQLDERFAALTQTATKSADETKATLTALETRLKALEGDTPESKRGFKASEAGGVDIISGVLAQFAASQGLDVSKLGVKNSLASKSDNDRIVERLTGEWAANGTAPIA